MGCRNCCPFFDSELWPCLLNRKARQSLDAFESNTVDVLMLKFFGVRLMGSLILIILVFGYRGKPCYSNIRAPRLMSLVCCKS